MHQKRLARQQVILDILSDQRITTQRDMMMALRDRGYLVTGPTVSRDLRELGIVRMYDDRHRYHLALLPK